MLIDILIYKSDDSTYSVMNWDYDSRNKNFIQSKFNDGIINITNYINKDYTNLGNKKLKCVFLNDDSYDLRTKNTKYLNKQSNKVKLVDTKPEFFPNNKDVKIIEEINGHKVIEITNKDGTKQKYREIPLGKNDKNNKEYTFIINEEDKCILENVYVYNDNFLINIDHLNNEEKKHVVTYKNPKWSFLCNQYIATAINISGSGKETVYIHRLLLGCQKDNQNTVDHINGNKFDNRRSNLRITSMSVQNQNRDIIKRDKILDNILNPDNKNDIPKLTFDNLLFISFREEDREYFDIEFKVGRTGLTSDIKLHSTKAKIFKDDNLKARRVKLCHAICIRYLTAEEYPNIIKEKIDNKNFASIDDFKTNSNALITEVMNTPYTVDTFLDYMNSLKIPKYTDPRKPKTVSNVTPINDIKFDGIQYSSERDKYNASFDVNKKDTPRKKITFDGSGSKNLSTEDKKCFALVQRYNLLITLENDINTQLHGDTPFTGSTNTNTTNLKSLTDFKFDSESKTKFANFTELRTYTEECINKFLAPQTPYTLETFAQYVTKKAKNTKTNLEISKLQYNYPILTS
jgi:hypothetical protein